MRRPTPPPRSAVLPPPASAAPLRPAFFVRPDLEPVDALDDESPPTVPRGGRRALPTADPVPNARRSSPTRQLAATASPGTAFAPVSVPVRPLSSKPPPLSDRIAGAGYTTPPPPPVVSTLNEMLEHLPGSVFAERYKIDRLIGRGSTSLVFAAEAAGSLFEPTPIALKVLDPTLTDGSTLARFHAESRALQVLTSENVPLVYDVGLGIFRGADGFGETKVPYIAMEHLRGQDLRTYLLEHGPLDAHEVIDILSQVANVLTRAHGLGIVHRDLKPANVFLVGAEEGISTSASTATAKTRTEQSRHIVKLLDFGVALLVDADASPREPQHARGFHGTPWYMAPEQISGVSLTAAVDVWAIGLIAFRLLTKESYWAPRPVSQLLAEIVAGPLVLPTDLVERRKLRPRAQLGESFDAWFMRSCEINPACRFRSPSEQVLALGTALERDGRSR